MKRSIFLMVLLSIFGVSGMTSIHQTEAGASDIAAPPQETVKLIFIHHSVGGHWLAHNNGMLVEELNKNNYYVNDITYGWEPPALSDSVLKKLKRQAVKIQSRLLASGNSGVFGIGNRTDIGHMPDWFLGPDSKMIMQAVYNENLETRLFGDHSNSISSRPLENPDPAAENRIIMFKSCFPNSQLSGKPDDPPTPAEYTLPQSFSAGSEHHTVANAKRVFNELLVYFQKRPDKFFVIVTPPPRRELPDDGRIARGFSNWLVHDWLEENDYTVGNVMVFDLFNVLTSKNGDGNDAGQETGNHHRIWQGQVQHIVQSGHNRLVYSTAEDDDHPSPSGLQKATKEFVPLLNYYYGIWREPYGKGDCPPIRRQEVPCNR